MSGSQVFEPSTRLEAWPPGYNGWYSARCVARNDNGTYHVLFDDQEEVDSLDPSRVRAPTKLLVGTTAAVLYRNEWVSCFVSHVAGASGAELVTVTFSNGERQPDLSRSELMFPPSQAEGERENKDRLEEKTAEHDPNVAATKLQAVWRGRQVKKANLLQRTKMKRLVHSVPSDQIDTPAIAEEEDGDEERLHQDDAVSVNYHASGNYYPGRIGSSARKGGRIVYEILYDDGDIEIDVPRERIVPRTLASAEDGQDAALQVSGGEPAPSSTVNAAVSSSNGAGVATGAGTVGASTGSATAPEELLARFDPVSVNYHSSGNYYPGKIARVVTKEGYPPMYDILYEDGDVEASVPRDRIVALGQVGGAPVSFQPTPATSLDHQQQAHLTTPQQQQQQQQQNPQHQRVVGGDRTAFQHTQTGTPHSVINTAPAAPFRARTYNSDGSQLSEARRLMRSALALDLMVEWMSCWGGGGGQLTSASTAEATVGLQTLTHPDVHFEAPALGVKCSSIRELLAYRADMLNGLGLLSFDSARVVDIKDTEISCSCHVHEFDTCQTSQSASGGGDGGGGGGAASGQPCLHAQVSMTLTRQQVNDDGGYVVTACNFNVVWRSSRSGMPTRK